MYNTSMKEKVDLIIIGGGVAGLSAALYGSRSALQTVVLDGTGDADGAGGQAGQIAALENYPGVFPAVGGGTFIETMRHQAEYFGAKIIHDSAVSLDKVGGKFIVTGRGGEEWTAAAVILATGAGKRKLGVAGEAELTGRGVSYCATCDGPFFKNKRIAVVGGGDSALSEALYLSALSPFVTIVHRRREFRASAVLQERVKKANIALQLGCTVQEITGQDTVQGIKLLAAPTLPPAAPSASSSMSSEGEASVLPCDAVFVCVGTVPRTSLVDFLPKDEGGYIKTDSNMQTACPGLFAVGDVRSTPLRQVVTAAADGAVAAMAVATQVGKAT